MKDCVCVRGVPLHLAPTPISFQERRKLLGEGFFSSITDENILKGLLLREERPFSSYLREGKDSLTPDRNGLELDFTNQLEKITTKLEGDENKFVSSTHQNICPAITAIASGLMVGVDGTKCITPMPNINRKLSRKRLKDMMLPTSIKDAFLKEGIKDHYTFYPFSLGLEKAQGVKIRGAVCTAFEEKLALDPVTCGLRIESVRALWRAFAVGFEYHPGYNAEGVPLGLIGTVLCVMQEVFFQDAEKPDGLRQLLGYLLSRWQELHKIELDWKALNCWSSTGDMILLLKVLWVVLDFPLLAAVEGMARLYCANHLLLKEDYDDGLPAGFTRSAEFSVKLIGVDVLSQPVEEAIFMYGVNQQSRYNLSANNSIADVLPPLCQKLKILPGQLQEFLSKNTKTKWGELFKEQKEKLKKELESWMEKTSFMGQFLDGINLEERFKEMVTLHRRGDRKKMSPKVPVLCMTCFLLHLDSVETLCRTPYETALAIFQSNQSTNGAGRKEIWWVPETNSNEKPSYYEWYPLFEQYVFMPAVDFLANGLELIHLPEEERELGCVRDGSKYRAWKLILKEWLYSYLRELVQGEGGGLYLACPSFDDCARVSELFEMTIEAESATNVLFQALLKTQGQELSCNLFSVATYVLLYIWTAKPESKMKMFQKYEGGDPGTYIMHSCPLFQAPTDDTQTEWWSLFKLTDWLLCGTLSCGEEASLSPTTAAQQAAATKVETFLAGLDENQQGLLKTFLRGGSVEDNQMQKHLFQNLTTTTPGVPKSPPAKGNKGTPKKNKRKGGGGKSPSKKKSKPNSSKNKKPTPEAFSKIHVNCICVQEEHGQYKTGWRPYTERVECFEVPIGNVTAYLGNIPKQLLEDVIAELESSEQLEELSLHEDGDWGAEMGGQYRICKKPGEKCEALIKGIVAGLEERNPDGMGTIGTTLRGGYVGFVGVGEDEAPSHQILHHEKAEPIVQEVGEAYICFFAMKKTGAVIRVDRLDNDSEKVVSFEFLFIPYGFVACIDLTQPHGGNYFTRTEENGWDADHNMGFLTLATEDWEWGDKEQALYSKFITSRKPATRSPADVGGGCDIDAISQFMKASKALTDRAAEELDFQEEHVSIGQVEYTEGLNAQNMSFNPVTWGGMDSLSVDYVPVGIFVPLLQYFQSSGIKGKFDQEARTNEVYDYQTFKLADEEDYYDLDAEVPEYRYLHLSKLHSREFEINKLKPLEDGLKGGLPFQDNEAVYTTWDLVCTNDQPSFQFTHVINSDVFKDGHAAWICIIPLEEPGCTFRMLRPSEEVQEMLQTLKEPFETPLETSTHRPLQSEVYVNVPFGAIFIANAKQFQGGHFADADKLRLIGTFSNFQFGYSPVGLRRYLPYPRSQCGAVWKRATKTFESMANAARKNYIIAYQASMEASKASENSHGNPSAGTDKPDDASTQQPAGNGASAERTAGIGENTSNISTGPGVALDELPIAATVAEAAQKQNGGSHDRPALLVEAAEIVLGYYVSGESCSVYIPVSAGVLLVFGPMKGRRQQGFCFRSDGKFPLRAADLRSEKVSHVVGLGHEMYSNAEVNIHASRAISNELDKQDLEEIENLARNTMDVGALENSNSNNPIKKQSMVLQDMTQLGFFKNLTNLTNENFPAVCGSMEFSRCSIQLFRPGLGDFELDIEDEDFPEEVGVVAKYLVDAMVRNKDGIRTRHQIVFTFWKES